MVRSVRSEAGSSIAAGVVSEGVGGVRTEGGERYLPGEQLWP